MDVLSWPWVQAYTAFSACLLAGCIYNYNNIYEEEKELLIENKLSHDSPAGRPDDDNVNNEELYSTGLWCHAMETFYLWVLVNTLCCFLLLMAKCIQFVVFGDLRINEKQNLKEKICNFLFYKLIVLFGVLNVQTERELATWCLCFSALLFLQLLAQLFKDRFEYLSSCPSTLSLGSHMRVLLGLISLFVFSGGLSVICVLLGFSYGMHTLSFMAAECLLVTIYMSHTIIRYTIHLYDLFHEGSWEGKEVFIYNTDLVMEMSILFLDMIHHINMLLYGNVWFSVADLFILTKLRFLSREMQRRLFQHKNYQHIYDVMDKRFSMATMEELASHDDRCVICWEQMYTAYKLPCGHLFHKSCLRSWLEQNMSCPTCRMSVNIMSGGHTGNEQERASLPALFSLGQIDEPNFNRNPSNYHSQLFHFDGSQIANWLPGFSVEVLHSSNLIILLQADDSQEHREEEMLPQEDMPE